MRTPSSPLARRAFLGGALIGLPGTAIAQSLERALRGPAPIAAPTAPTQGVQQGAVLTPTANPDTSWGWLLSKGAASEPTTLLAAGGPNRTVWVIEWSAQGRLNFAGTSPDPEGRGGLDLIGRLQSSPTEPGDPTQAPLWGAWERTGTDRQGGATRSTGRGAWPMPLAPLTAALVGERRRAQPYPLTGAGAFVCVFPHPGSPTTFDAVPGKPGVSELLPALAYLTTPDGPSPLAGVAGIRQSWVNEVGLGGMGLYQSADKRAWAFWVLSP